MTHAAEPDAVGAIKTARTFAKDLGERALASAVWGFLNALVVTQMTETSMWYTALGAGIGAGLATVKAAVAKLRGNKFSASLARSV